MKLGKKTVTLLTFAVATLVFVSTALADMALGSGYDLLKQAAKTTTAQMENQLDNFTVETLLTFKADGNTFYQTSLVAKYDMKQKARVEETVQQRANGETTSYYSYVDSYMTIYKGNDDVYYVTEYENERREEEVFSDPFKEEGAPEVEKIIDALVGHLKDQVQVEERAEGGRLFSGNLTEMQVPPIVNALSSFVVKQMVLDRYRWREELKLPPMENDLYVKKMSGKAVEDERGLLEQINGEMILVGKDQQGKEHELVINAVIKLSDIGTTQVSKPDLTNAKVERGSVDNSHGFSQKHVGTYKNDIIIEKDGQFVKIGERIVTIDRVEKDKVTGQYTEIIKPDYADLHPEPLTFRFEYDPAANEPFGFSYTNQKGELKYGQMFPSGPGKIYFEIEMELAPFEGIRSTVHPNYDSQFSRVFEE